MPNKFDMIYTTLGVFFIIFAFLYGIYNNTSLAYLSVVSGIVSMIFSETDFPRKKVKKK